MQRLVTLFSLLLLSLLTVIPSGAAPVATGPIPVQITVMAAETNKPIPAASIEFRENTGPGRVVANLTVDANGSGTVSLPKGTYYYLTRAAGMGTTRNYLYLDGQEKAEAKIGRASCRERV